MRLVESAGKRVTGRKRVQACNCVVKKAGKHVSGGKREKICNRLDRWMENAILRVV